MTSAPPTPGVTWQSRPVRITWAHRHTQVAMWRSFERSFRQFNHSIWSMVRTCAGQTFRLRGQGDPHDARSHRGRYQQHAPTVSPCCDLPPGPIRHSAAHRSRRHARSDGSVGHERGSWSGFVVAGAGVRAVKLHIGSPCARVEPRVIHRNTPGLVAAPTVLAALGKSVLRSGLCHSLWHSIGRFGAWIRTPYCALSCLQSASRCACIDACLREMRFPALGITKAHGHAFHRRNRQIHVAWP